MGQFDRQIATALRLIAKYGQSIIWNSIIDGASVDPLKPWKPTDAASTPHPDIKICFVPTNDTQWRKLLAYLKGTEVPTGKLAGLMGQVPFEPTLKDVVDRDGVILRIASLDLLSPNGQKILYTIEFEG